jgi:hypothetical protein
MGSASLGWLSLTLGVLCGTKAPQVVVMATCILPQPFVLRAPSLYEVRSSNSGMESRHVVVSWTELAVY